MALRLDPSELREIKEAWTSDNTPDNLRSFNQTTAAYTRNYPLFLNIEVKKRHTPRNAMVQLAIWEAAALIKKMEWMKWDTMLPIPGIIVDGHEWELFIFIEYQSRLVSLQHSLFLLLLPCALAFHQ